MGELVRDIARCLSKGILLDDSGAMPLLYADSRIFKYENIFYYTHF